MRHLMLILVGLLFVGCASDDEKSQAEFVPVTDAALASDAEYEVVWLVYGRDNDDLNDEPSYVVVTDRVPTSPEDIVPTKSYVIPGADRHKLRNKEPGAIIQLPTLHKYDTVRALVGIEAEKTLHTVPYKKMQAKEPSKVSDLAASLVEGKEYDAFSVVKCFNQRIKQGPAQLEILQPDTPDPPGPQSSGEYTMK